MISHLQAAEIIAISRTCRKLSNLCRDIQETQWNVDLKLRRFFLHPKHFRWQLANCNAVVSGSFALQFFDRVVWPDSDFDIFVPYGDQTRAFGRYLVRDEGYKILRTTHDNSKLYRIDGIAKVCMIPHNPGFA